MYTIVRHSLLQVLLTMTHPSRVKLPLFSMIALLLLVLKLETTTSHIVTSAVASTVKKFKSVESPLKTTSPSAIIVNFLL